MVAFVTGMAGQLRDCGIELLVEDLDVTGDSLFQQLRWPNEFETLFTMRSLSADPDADLEAFESSHATSAEQEIDANPGGYRSAVADQLILQAREIDRPGRAGRTCMGACRMSWCRTCLRGRSGSTPAGPRSPIASGVPTDPSTRACRGIAWDIAGLDPGPPGTGALPSDHAPRIE